jgi:DNA-directed RNA polymerase subunit beta
MFVKTKVFTSHPHVTTEIPPLNKIQFDSFRWLVEKGISRVFKEYSPIHDYTAKELELSFANYWLDEPKISETQARHDGLSYEAPLRVKTILVNLKTKEKKEQDIYFGDFPQMTSRGTFVVNGVERTVVSQLTKSAGVYFTLSPFKQRQIFGAQILPARGSWIEFETDPQGVIGVRIDKKRRVPATAFLRIFGLETDEAILKAFQDVDASSQYLAKTLKHDTAQTVADAYLEVYRRLKPGEPPVYDNAKSFLDNMFKKEERYDFGEVGRFKFNQRLYGKMNLASDGSYAKLLSLEDVKAVIRQIIVMNNDPKARPDDIDHLGNRRIKAVGEMLQERLMVGMVRMRRAIQDRMSTCDPLVATPAQLVVTSALLKPVKDFLMNSQLSQFMDQVNPLSQLEHKRTISSMGPGGLKRERAGFEVRDVHISHYGRVCPIQTPEGANIGLVSRFAAYSRLNPFGFIETPYLKVEKGRVTSEIVWLDAYEEEKYRIAHGSTQYDHKGNISEKEVRVRFKGEIQVIQPKEVEYLDISPQQLVSISAGLIPFLENTDPNRALMAANMERQAVPCVLPQAPLVGTGFEERAAKDSGQLLLADRDGEVIKVDASQIVIAYPDSGKHKNHTYRLTTFSRSNQDSCIHQRPLVKVGDKIKRGQMIADGESTTNGVLSLGQNLLVAFLPWYGYNFDDAIIISERVLKEDRFTSVTIKEFICEVRDTKLGPEITTFDIPNVSEERLKDLDEEGIVRIGAEVEANDILVGKITPRGEAELSAEEKLLRAIFGEKAKEVKDTSLRLEHGRKGRVIGIKVFSRDKGDKLSPGVIKRIHVEIAELRKVSAGDKLAGRHGNKGVVSIVVPEEDMPYLSDGTPVDVVLNPLGVVGRMNIGQILETHLGWAAHSLGYRAITPVFAGAKESEIKQELKTAGLPQSGQTAVYDGKTGECLGEKITVGYIYIMKLSHMVEDKIHMRATGPYALITQQPLGGKARMGGQRFGEMEVWALEGYGAAHTLQEMLTIKSDDIFGRTSTMEALIKGEKIKKPNLPASFAVLVSELRALGFKVDLLGVQYVKRDQERTVTTPPVVTPEVAAELTESKQASESEEENTKSEDDREAKE